MSDPTDPLRLPILRGLLGAGDRAPTAAELLELIDAAGWPRLVMKYDRMVENTLGDLEGEGLVEQANVAAEYYDPDVGPPKGVRRWLLTADGRAAAESADG